MYDVEVLKVATKNGHTSALQWWLDSGLDLEYRFFDIEESLEDCCLEEGAGRERVELWWERLGWASGMGADAWTRCRNLRKQKIAKDAEEAARKLARGVADAGRNGARPSGVAAT